MTIKRELLFVGKFLEFGYEDAPPLASARGRGLWPNKEKILAYLDGGKLMVMSPGLTEDAFQPDKRADSLSIVTDGKFAWHVVLAYYVKHYDLALPPEFEEQMARNGFRIPTSVNTRELKLPDTL
jgi:hypothetical protein